MLAPTTPMLYCDAHLRRAAEIALALHAAGIRQYDPQRDTAGYHLSARHDRAYVEVEYWPGAHSPVALPWWTGTPAAWAAHDQWVDHLRTALERAGLPVVRFVEGSGEAVLRVETT